MKSVARFLVLRREERLPVVFFLLWQLVLQALALVNYIPLFLQPCTSYYKLFVNNYHLSGFDPLTYLVISDWDLVYDVNRHPLLALFYYPFALLNQGLMSVSSVNFAVFIVTFVLLFFTVYGFVLMLRIQRDLLNLPIYDAVLLSFLLYSFAHILIASVAPDHFILSLFMLLLTLYIAGKQLKGNKKLSDRQTILLFIFTAGISLNNGLKVLVASLFTRGRHFFKPKHLFPIIILPAFLMVGIGEGQHYLFVSKKIETAKMKKRKVVRAERDSLFEAFKDTTAIKDSAKQVAAFGKLWKEHRKEIRKAELKQPAKAHAGKPMSSKRFLNWTDVSTSRTKTVIENLFGESIQLHQKHTLEDVMRTRPVIVSYDNIVNYVVEGILFLLFITGIWIGRRNKFLQMALAFAALDMLLHVGLGFGINEVYIMTAHWIYIIPLSMAVLLCRSVGKTRKILRLSYFILTIFLIVYNTSLFVKYLNL